MAQSLTEIMNEEEEAVLSFYEQHPGATWAEAADALGFDDKKASTISLRLAMAWKVLIMKFDPINPSSFTVRQI